MSLKDFFDLPPALMTAIATVLGFALLGELTANQQNSLGNFLMLTAQVLETNASQQQLLEGRQQGGELSELRESVEELRRELAALTARLNGGE
ncbi:MAG: hypothetical protein IJU78_09210 [Clostridia bacterium]|nr:hypothetical protein [Clostridia bacterium]